MVHDYVLNSYCDYFKLYLATDNQSKNNYYINKLNNSGNLETKEFNENDEEPKEYATEESESETNCTNSMNQNRTIYI